MQSPRALLAVVSLVLTALTFWPATAGVLTSDDYVALRPGTSESLTAAWTGSWHPEGTMDRYYRPLASLLHTAQFDVFGLNARAHHLSTLAAVVVLGTLLGAVVTRVAGAGPGLAATALFVTNPLTATSLALEPFLVFQAPVAAAWILGVGWWWHTRNADRPPWGLIVAGTLVAAGFKEDALLLLPAIAHLHWRDRGSTPAWWRLSLISGITIAAYLCLRLMIYPEFGALNGDDRGLFTGLSLHAAKHALGWFSSDFAMPEAWSAIVVAGTLAAGLAAGRDTPHGRVWAVGAVVFVWSYLPLLSWENTHHSRSHVLALASSLLATGTLSTLWRHAKALRGGSAITIGIGILWVGLQAAASHTEATAYLPCGEVELSAADAMASDSDSSRDLREILAGTAQRCAAGAPVRTPVPPAVSWATELPFGDALEVTTLWPLSSPPPRLQVRHPEASSSSPLIVDVHEGGQGARVTITDGEWHTIALPVRKAWLDTLRQAHRADVRLGAHTSGLDLGLAEVVRAETPPARSPLR